MLKLHEIAKLTGTSKSAVSRVFNNNGYVAEEKRQRIKEALRENGYQVTTSRSAIPKSADKIVLIITESLENIAYTEYISGINTCLMMKGLHPFIYVSFRSPIMELKQVEYATSLGVGGIIMLSAVESQQLLKMIDDLSCPLVLINRRLPSANVDSVVLDNYKVGYIATRYLIEHGHKRILHIAGSSASSSSVDRCRGYIDAMADAGLPYKNSIIRENNTYEDGIECSKHLLSEYTAIFSINDTVATGFIDGIYERGFCCPQNISVICCENTYGTKIGKVKLTTIGYNNTIMGKTASELLIERMENSNGQKKTISYAPIITERDSVKMIEE